MAVILLAALSFAIDPIELQETCQQIEQDPHFRMVRNVFTQNPNHPTTRNWDCICTPAYYFSHEVSSNYPASNQKNSGRCWIFGALNVLRRDVSKKFEAVDFEFSQSYLFFHDKIEKANCFLERMMESYKEDLNSQLVKHLLFTMTGDGGDWHNVVDLVKKYGLVPKTVYPDNEACNLSLQMNKVLAIKLTKDAEILRKMLHEGYSIEHVRKEKQMMMKEVYQILVAHMGAPPKIFDFIYYDKNKTLHLVKDLTPHAFVELCLETPLEDYITLAHTPRNDTPYYMNIRIENSNNMMEGTECTFLNVPIEILKQVTKDSLLGDIPVSFAADVGSQSDKISGIMDANLYDYGSYYQADFSMNKGSRLQYGLSTPTHMMAFTGVHLEDDIPIRWKVENSWGTDVGNKGFFSMSDNWFDEYVYYVVIPKKFVPDYLLDLFNNDPIILNTWDPLCL